MYFKAFLAVKIYTALTGVEAKHSCRAGGGVSRLLLPRRPRGTCQPREEPVQRSSRRHRHSTLAHPPGRNSHCTELCALRTCVFYSGHRGYLNQGINKYNYRYCINTGRTRACVDICTHVYEHIFN